MLPLLQLGLFPNSKLAMTIKAVFFDAAGTLIKPVRGVGESYAALAAKHGKQVSSSDIAARFCVDSGFLNGTSRQLCGEFDAQGASDPKDGIEAGFRPRR